QSFDGSGADDIKYGAMKTVVLRNKRSQYNYGMCWACVVATIVNTLNWTSYTGYDVCNRMGIGFDEGAEVDEIKTAFSYYGVDYKKTTSKLPWNSVVKNIDAGYPIAMIMDPYPSGQIGHSVTLYGYDKSNETIRIWNSQIENSNKYSDYYNMEGYSKDVSYYDARYDITSSNPVPISEQGRVFVWKQTLSEYQ
ncbi:MAG: C39 family peptidase, partial [Butyrivibrio sp.]|nr:C39 family peptidase [Butyrivibrio sp.]